jgi:RNA polymerase sigma factor for flagellar operon FliA
VSAPEPLDDAGTALVLANLAVVGYQVSEVLPRVPASVTRDDLSSAGFLALVLAARSYDASTGVPFARYAALRVRGAILDELRSMDWASRGARARAREMGSTVDRLTVALGRTPTRDEVAAAMGADAATVDQARADLERRVLSLDVPGSPVAEVLPDAAPTPEEVALTRERLAWMRAAVDELPERLRVVVEGVFFDDRAPADLAEELGVTPSRISQLRTEALTLLRDGINTGLDPELVPEPARPDGVAERRRQRYFAAVAERAVQGALVRPDVERTPA